MINSTIQITEGTNKGFLEVDNNSAVSVLYSTADSRNLTVKRGIGTEQPFKLLNSNNNAVMLGKLFDINATDYSYDVNRAVKCVYMEDGELIMDNAVLQLTSIQTSVDNAGTVQVIGYSVVVRDQTAQFFVAMGSKELTDLDFSEYNHAYNSTNIINSFSNTSGYKYLMPIADTAEFYLQDFRPAIYLLHYVQKIFQSNGFAFEFGELTAANVQLNKWIVPYNGEQPETPAAALANIKVIVNNAVAQNFVNTVSGGLLTLRFPTLVSLPTEIQDPSNLFSANVYTPPFYIQGGANINFKINVDWQVEVINSSGATAYMVASGGQPYIKPLLGVGYNGAVSNVGLANMKTIGNGNIVITSGTSFANGTTILEAGSSEININASNSSTAHQYRVGAGFYVSTQSYWRTANSQTAPAANVTVRVVVKAITVEIMPNVTELGYGMTIDLNTFVPRKVKQADFIKSVFTMLNIIPEAKQFNSNVIVLKTRNKYYDDGAEKDWTSKLVKNEEQETIFLSNVTAKRLIHTYKEDDDDANKTYKQATGEVYGQHEYVFESEHVKSIDTEEIIFSPTPVGRNNLGAVVPMITGIAPKNNIRVLFDGGVKTCTSYKIVDYTDAAGTKVGTTTTSYPLLSHFNNDVNPTFDLNFAVNDYYFYQIGAKTNNNLINLNWRRTLNQQNNGKVFTAELNLTRYDIAQFKLSDKIFLIDAWFNVNKLTYNPNGNGYTKVEFITVDDEVDFAKFKVVPPTKPTQPLPGDVIRTPIRAILDKVKALANVVLTNSPISINGRDNYVAENVKAASILGNGNIVASEKALVIGDENIVTAEKALVIGNSVEANSDGVYTPMLQFSDGTVIESAMSEAGRWGRIEVPSAFDHALAPFEIVRSVHGTARLINFNADTFRKRIYLPVTKFVDQINGLDTNTGDSWAQAYKSFTKLRTVAFERALIAKGNYASVANPTFTTENEIISVGGNSTVCYGVIGTERTWTAVGSGTFSNVLTAAITVVVDTSKFDANGDYFRLTKLTSLVEVQSTPDSWWKDTGTNTLYVHYADGLTPSRTSAVMSISAVSFAVNQNQYRENIDFINGIQISNATANVSTASHKNCTYIFNTTTNGVTIKGNVKSYFENCKAAKNFLDGFNYHETSGYNPMPIEVGCYAYKNGENNTTSINNGSTVHESVVILRIGGCYFENEGPNIHDINLSKSLNIDCVAYSSNSVLAANCSDFAVGASNTITESATIWLDGCSSHIEDSVFGAENRSDYATIYARNTNLFNVKTGTTINLY